MFKIISKKEYNRLLDSNVVKSDNKIISELNGRVNELLKNKEDDKKDYEILLKRKELECENAVIVATQEKILRIAELELETGKLKQQVEMYEKAFENLGFDVKDMKEILGKLVDGIVSKNTVQVIK